MAFRIGQITDTHTYSPPPPELAAYANRELGTGCSRDLPLGDAGFNVPPGKRFPCDAYDRGLIAFYKECCSHDIDLLLHTGDLVTGGATHERLKYVKGLLDRAADETGVPYHVVRGNHDLTIRHPVMRGDEAFRDVFGPSTYWFEHKGWAVLIIDEYYRCYEHTNAYLTLSPQTLRHVETLLLEIPRSMPLILCLHTNPVGTSRFHRGEELLHLLRRHNLQLHLFGHVQNNYISRYQGVPFVTVAGAGTSFDTAPLSYNIVTCREEGEAVCDFHPHVAHLPKSQTPGLPSATGRAVPGDDWAELRGPQGTRAASVDLPAHAPQLAWCAQLPGSLSVGSPNLLNGRVVVGTKTQGRFEQCMVRAFDAETGEVLWTRPVDASVEGGVLLRDGVGYCGTTAGSMYALDLDAGSIVWSWNSDENYPIACEPTLDERGLLHFGANWEVYALDHVTGRWNWRRLACDRGLSYFCPGHASPLVVGNRVFHQRAYNALQQDRQSILQVFTADRGALQEISHPRYANFPGQRQSSPIWWQGHIVTVGEGLVVFDPDDLQQARIHAEHASGSTTAAIQDGRAYVSYHDGIVAYDLKAEGRELWRTPHEPARLHFNGGVGWWEVCEGGRMPAGNFSSPLISRGKLIVCDTGGHCRCLDANDGGELWRLQTPAPILTAPTVSGQTLFFGDYDGRLYAFAWDGPSTTAAVD